MCVLEAVSPWPMSLEYIGSFFTSISCELRKNAVCDSYICLSHKTFCWCYYSVKKISNLIMYLNVFSQNDVKMVKVAT